MEDTGSVLFYNYFRDTFERMTSLERCDFIVEADERGEVLGTQALEAMIDVADDDALIELAERPYFCTKAQMKRMKRISGDERVIFAVDRNIAWSK